MNLNEIKQRIQGYARPNSVNARKLLEPLVEEVQAQIDRLQCQLDELETVMANLEEYEETKRDHFTDASEYSEAKAEAWETFTESLNDIEEM